MVTLLLGLFSPDPGLFIKREVLDVRKILPSSFYGIQICVSAVTLLAQSIPNLYF